MAENLVEALMAKSKRDHAAAETEFNKLKIRTRQTWKGDHRPCDHTSGICGAKNGWQVNGEALEAGKFPFSPILYEMPVEKRFMARIGYAEAADKEDEPYWKAKGWLDMREVKNVAKIRPSDSVQAFLIERYEKELRHLLKEEGAKFEQVNAELSAARTKFNVALGSGKGKADG